MSFDLKLENGDIKYDREGELQTVSGTDKLIQDIVKILLTQIGTNRYHLWYGSELTDSVVGNPADASFLSRDAEMAVSTALENLASLQISQMSYQSVSPQEAIGAIKKVYVERDMNDPRAWVVKVSVISKALTEISEEFSISL